MNKTELVNAIAEKAQLSKADAKKPSTLPSKPSAKHLKKTTK